MLSMWRDDAQKNLRGRALHLLTKSYPAVRWVWVVGDTHDDTYRQLVDVINEVRPCRQVDLLQIDTGIIGDDPPTRRRRLGATANVWLDMIKDTDDYLLVHESDILSPMDLIERFLHHAAAGRCPIAGWPILPISDTQAVFYDIWAYRKDGQMFTNGAPFHACYKPDEPFEVDSVGTAWLLAAEDVRKGARFGDDACLTLCAELRAMGRRFWVDPQLIVVQPRELWISHSTA